MLTRVNRRGAVKRYATLEIFMSAIFCKLQKDMGYLCSHFEFSIFSSLSYFTSSSSEDKS